MKNRKLDVTTVELGIVDAQSRKERRKRKMKGLVSMTTGIVTGVAVGTAVGMAVKKMKPSKQGTKTKKMTSMALNAMGEAFHNMANHVR